MNSRLYIKHRILVCLMMLGTIYNVHSANIIFDIGGVLLKPKKNKITSSMGYSNLLLYTCSFNNPFALQERWFSILHSINAPEIKPNIEKATYRGAPLPDIMCSWLRSDTSCQRLLHYATAMIEHISTSSAERDILKTIALTTFHPETHSAMHTWIPEALRIVRKCYEQTDDFGNRKHQLYILSNYNSEAFKVLSQQAPEFFEYFDGIIISGDIGLIKPDPAIYQVMLKAYDLDPNECYFIDDQEENLSAAQTLGIHSIHCKNYNYKKVKADLIKEGLLKP